MRLKPLQGNWTENLGNCLKTDHNNSTDGGGDNNSSNNNNMLVSLIETSVGQPLCKMAYCTISRSPLSNPNYYLCRRAEETETLPLVDPMNTE